MKKLTLISEFLLVFRTRTSVRLLLQYQIFFFLVSHFWPTRLNQALVVSQIVILTFFITSTKSSVAAEQKLLSLEIEQLMKEEVTSVSKSRQDFADSTAAIYVINSEDIRRSGVTLVPELLRLVPGLHVARISSNQWAITARGFNGRFSNKLLVLVDGRTVYTPIFSGVYWEGLDLPLIDIERIEVIRGPGASLWGANAVNGVINIISKSASSTQGSLASLTIGDKGEGLVDLRHGIQPIENLAFRLSGRYSNRRGMPDTLTLQEDDDWSARRLGFRIDWTPTSSDSIVAQSDWYKLNLKRNYSVPSGPNELTNILDQGTLSGSTVMTRWEHSFSLASRASAQFYFQREHRDDLFSRYHQETFDVDLQHDLAIHKTAEITWGLSYRLNRDDFDAAPLFNIAPPSRDTELLGVFAQGRLDLFEERLGILVGTKFEHNSLSGWEHQPNARFIWKPADRQRIWASIARAARTPARTELDESSLEIFQSQSPVDGSPVSVVFTGDSDFDSENVTSAELGYRLWPANNYFLDIAAFYSDYSDLRSSAPNSNGITSSTEGLVQEVSILNAEKGVTYGLEISADWRPNNLWRLRVAYSFLRSRFTVYRRFADINLFPSAPGNNRNPKHQLSLHSSIDMPHDIELDLGLRYADSIDSVQITGTPLGVAEVQSYLTLDMRVAWRPNDQLEVSFSGRNLTDSPHVEFLKEANTVSTEVQRSFHGQVTWVF